MLADDTQYNKFKDIFTRDKGADKGRGSKRNLNIESAKKEVFLKFKDAQNVNDFEEILENDFEDQYDTLVLMYGEGGSNPKYGNFDKTLAVLWNRLEKLLDESVKVKTKPDRDEEIIDSFISNYKNKEVQDAFFRRMEQVVEKSTDDTRSKVIKNFRTSISYENQAKIVDILDKNFGKNRPSSLDEFYNNDTPYFNYFTLEYYFYDPKPPQDDLGGWEQTGENLKLKGDNRNLTRYSMLFEVETDTKKQEKDLVKALFGETTQIVGIIQNYSLLYEIFKKSDTRLKVQKLKNIKFQQERFVVKQMGEEEKIKKYLELMSKRTGVSPLDMAITIKQEKTLKQGRGGGFFRQDGKYADVHPIIENLLLEGLSSAIQKVGRETLLDDKVITTILTRDLQDKLKEAGTVSDEEIREKQMKLTNKLQQQTENKRGIYFSKEMLQEFLEVARTNEDLKNSKKAKDVDAANLGNFIKDGKIQLGGDSIFEGATSKMMEKLVPITMQNEEYYITFNESLQRKLSIALPVISKITGKRVALDKETQVVGFPDGKGTEVKFNRTNLQEGTFAKFEKEIEVKFPKEIDRVIFDYIRTTGEIFIDKEEKTKNTIFGENPAPNYTEGKRDFTEDFQNYTTNISKKEAFAFAVWIAKLYLNKDYSSLLNKIDEARKDLKLENADLVNSIRSFGSTLENDLKQLKPLVVEKIDEKLNEVANRSGKFSKILKTKKGQRLETHLKSMGFLGSEESG